MALRVDLERLQRGKGVAEAENLEYEAKLERLRKERSLSTSFDGQRGGGLADLRGTAATTMGSMWTRGVSIGGGLGQELFYVPRGVVLNFSAECPPYVYIAWERRFGVFIVNQGLGHTISSDVPQIAAISCVDDAYLLAISARPLLRSTDEFGGIFAKRLLVLPSRIVFTSVAPFRML